MTETLTNEMLSEFIGYNPGDRLFQSNDEKEKNKFLFEEKTSMHTELRNFLLLVAGFVRKPITDLYLPPDKRKAYLLEQRQDEAKEQLLTAWKHIFTTLQEVLPTLATSETLVVAPMWIPEQTGAKALGMYKVFR